jgi:5'-deoxynucleotidase YfbR-like HD superfamily hydrolase
VTVLFFVQEAIVGDITPPDQSGISKQEKHALERKAMDDIAATLQHSPVAKEIVALFEEYESAATPEAQLVKVCAALPCSSPLC